MDYQGDPSSRARYGNIYGSLGPYQRAQGMQQMYVQDSLSPGNWDGKVQEAVMQQTQQTQQMHHVQQMREFEAQNQYTYQQNQQYVPVPSIAPPNAYFHAASQPQYHFPQYTERLQQRFPQFSDSVQVQIPSSNQLQQVGSQPKQQQASRHVHENSLRQQYPPPVSMESVKPLSKPKQVAGQSIDPQMLMVSLAEEYFEAAHSLASLVARNMRATSLEEYQGLIATGLGCLESVLKKTRLAPKLEARIRLR
jgi:hypothetical protein